jgi:RND family efflux transporter MFP subunit
MSSSDTDNLAEARRRTGEGTRGGSWLGRIVVVAIAGGLIGWSGVRIAAALKQKQALAVEREAVAKAALDDGPRSAAVVRGVAERWTPRVPLDGTLQPARDADLGFKAGGRLQSIRVKLGDCVSAGATLGTLESSEAAVQVQAAEAQLRSAEAQLALARDAESRTGRLVGQGAASQQLGVQTTQQGALAQAQRDAAAAQLALAQANLRNHVLSAPFAGCVTRVPAGVGMIVAPGAPMFHLQDTSTLKLAGTLGEGDAALVKIGAPVEMTLDGKLVRGRLVAVLSSVDASTRRVPVEAEIANPGRALRAGTFVRAEVVGTEPIDVVRLPGTVIRPGSQDEVLVVPGAKEGGAATLETRRVVFTALRDGAVLVRAGLTPADVVLAAPVAETAAGQSILVGSLAPVGRPQ